MSDCVTWRTPLFQSMPVESFSHPAPNVISSSDKQCLHMVLEVLSLRDGMELLQTIGRKVGLYHGEELVKGLPLEFFTGKTDRAKIRSIQPTNDGFDDFDGQFGERGRHASIAALVL